jgi:hypothetical protein
MTDAAPASLAHDLDMVTAMVEGAYALGMAANRIALACQDDRKAFFEASAEYRHCFFAVRMGLRLKMSLGAGVKPAAGHAEAEAVEREADERERPERDPPERERDREGEREPVSMPAFLKSLGVVVRNAERRKDQLPREIATQTLPRLHSLLAQAKGGDLLAPEPTKPVGRPTAVAILERPQAPPAMRSRLFGSAAATPRGLPPRRSG